MSVTVLDNRYMTLAWMDLAPEGSTDRKLAKALRAYPCFCRAALKPFPEQKDRMDVKVTLSAAVKESLRKAIQAAVDADGVTVRNTKYRIEMWMAALVEGAPHRKLEKALYAHPCFVRAGEGALPEQEFDASVELTLSASAQESIRKAIQAAVDEALANA